MTDTSLLGLRSLIYPAENLEKSKTWWSQVLGIDPYFDQPFYVGFNIGGFELGLNPGASKENGPVTYWGVDDIEIVVAHFVENGANIVSAIADVGERIKVAELRSAQNELFGLIYNPHFKIEGSS